MQNFKSVSKLSRKFTNICSYILGLKQQTATLIILGFIGCFAAISLAWLWGEKTIVEFFQQLAILQETPPFWITAPQFEHRYYLFLPTVILLIFIQFVIRISPRPKNWSRITIIVILLTLIIRYLLWRTLATLNFSTPINGIFSISLWLLEIVTLGSGILQLYLLLNISDRRQEANRYSQAVMEGFYLPSVDILIPTYNEPEFILRRTVVGCQAINYPNKKVYILDDTQRIEIKNLAKELGCYYITRPDNRHAKAGNLNHAFTQTQGELIAIFDADFIPTTNFLNRTVGFFQNKKIALVQTPQSFYNTDPVAKNLGLEKFITSEEEVFYRQIQPMKDAAKGIVCAGTSFVVRRSYLKEIGCFVTESISEDYFTGIRLSAQGYQVIYLNEKVSAGLAAESISSHIFQRLRWARGTLQAFFIPSNPLTIPGLKLHQRLAHLEGLLNWFSVVARFCFLIFPLIYTFFGIVPLNVSYPEIIYIFLPFYLVQLSTFHWLNFRSRSIVFSEISSLVSCVPITLTVIATLFSPFKIGFRVTPKGISRNQYIYNWKLAFPLIILLIATAVSFWINLTKPHFRDINLGLIWSSYNLVFISIALVVLLDAPKPDSYEWFALKRSVKIMSAHSNIWGVTESLSEGGAEIRVKEIFKPDELIVLEIPQEKLKLKGRVTRIDTSQGYSKISVTFEQLTTMQKRRLIELLFCQPGQWKDKQTPGEFYSIWLLFKKLFKFFFLTHKRKSCKMYS